MKKRLLKWLKILKFLTKNKRKLNLNIKKNDKIQKLLKLKIA